MLSVKHMSQILAILQETWNKKQILDPCEEDTEGAEKVYTLPRLTGHSLLSEEILMGKHIEDSKLCNPISSAYKSFLTDTSIVTSTLMEIEATLRLLGKQKSLLQTNGENSELFSATEPNFALFGDIKSGVSSEYAIGSCFNDATEVSTMVDDGRSLSKYTVDDKLLAYETNKECESDEKLNLNQSVNESNANTAFSKDHLHRVTEMNASTNQITIDRATTFEISMDFTVTDHRKTEQAIADQSTTDDAVIDRSSTKHTNMHQNTGKSIMDYTNTDHPSMEQSTIDYAMTDQSSRSHDNIDHNTMDYTTTTCQSTMNHTTTWDQSTNDHVISDQITVDQEIHENKMLDSVFGDQTRTKATDTCTVAESAVDNAFDDRIIDHGICVDNLADSSSLKTSELPPDYNVNSISISESNSNHVDYMKHENSLDQTPPMGDSAITERTVTRDTNLIQSSTDSMLSDVIMVSIDNTDGTVNRTRSDAKTGSNECHAEDKRTLITNIDKIIVEHVKTNHDCTENTDNTSNLSTSECDTSNHSFSDKNTTDKNDVAFDKCDIDNDITGKLSSMMHDIKDETSEQDLSGVTDDDKREKDCAWPSRNEQNTESVNNISDDKISMSQSENSEYSYCNSTKLKYTTGNTENLEEEKTNERGNWITILDSNISNKNKQITTNDSDIDILNYHSTVDSCTDEHLETMTHSITDPIPDNSAEHASMNDSGISTSTNSAVDRYLRKLEAQIDAEKWQAQQYIEQISRLWDSPFLCKNK